MANPQRENGHIDIANELGEALAKIRIPGEAMQILWVVIRKTYGFQKKEDWIAKSQFVESTGLCKQHVNRALDKLIAMNIVTQKGYEVTQKGYPGKLTYSLNKDYETWKPLPKKVTTPKKYPKKVQPVPFIGEPVPFIGEPVPQKGPHNNNLTITNLTITTLTKDITSGLPDCACFQEIVDDLNSKAKTRYKHASQKTQGLIRARWNEGFRVSDFKTVHDKKIKEWTGTDMAKFIRPETLYGTKFESYLNQLSPDLRFSDKTKKTIQAGREWIDESNQREEAEANGQK
jgi:phage replication O-like protein O